MNTPFTSISRQVATDTDTQAFGASLAASCSPGVVIYLHGVLGAGKTTFVRGFLRGLGFDGKVKSPTYTLVEPYELDKLNVFHFDLYRLLNAEELHAIGLEDYFAVNAVCLIEWPEKGSPILPAADLIANFDILEEQSGNQAAHPARQIRLEARTAKGDGILARL